MQKMKPETSTEEVFDLCEPEMETLRRAARLYGFEVDATRTRYSRSELEAFGLVREAYNSSELAAFGVSRNKVVTSFDDLTRAARDLLTVDPPFASAIRKWQIPVDLSDMRMLFSEFPPGSTVEPHVHPANTESDPGGSFRLVLTGSVEYAGRRFGPGDWFYIPNGVPYAFSTDEEIETKMMYCYAFFAPTAGNRFSFPIDLRVDNRSSSAVA